MMRLANPSRGAVLASVLACAVGIAACGTSFDSAASGEHLVNEYVKKYGRGNVTVKSVSCPGDVKNKVGTTYDCKVTLHRKDNNTDHSGTITIHIAKGNEVIINGAQDLHFSS